jgi:hypothetical protein
MKEKKMKTTFLNLALKTVFTLIVVITMQTIASAEGSDARRNRIVGLWNVQVTITNCNGITLFSFPALHKYELGGTGQMVPGTNPALLSPHVAVWNYVSGNEYDMAFTMFRFDESGTNIGYAVVRNNITINENGTQYSGSGQAESFDTNGISEGMVCPTFTGSRFK